MRGLILLFKFMTRLPIPIEPKFDSEELGKSMKFFPVVGIVTGILMYIFYLVGVQFIRSPFVLATVLVLIEIGITGAMHLDGLSDTFDGIFSYRSKQKMLEIMKDSRIGANGAIALIMYFLLKIIILGSIEMETSLMGLGFLTPELKTFGMGFALLVSPVVARANSVLNCAMTSYARSSGSAKELVEQTNRNGATIAILISTVYSLLVQAFVFPSLNPIYLVNIIFVTHVLGAYFAKLMERKIGGVTGDTLGAVLELSQLIVLLGIYIAIGIR
ncbi:adenosylcobinamide-GDP ribazoletransferase [Fusobacterium perfoetens]|uniref:adenosylcobinamide-GDP ribazoletransferase n=1 Tax=Fusobacterium perfoetens TaxID=852 RepID=UPI000482A53F|nr:adenosylcobinamide-GDP ribazoletransferase [Fusobacterium perfoetens]MCI6153303.1 adenosylcobinamide-GDP ribazoletransferase [Fusobacterium perfoetens]MDY3237821.1 adenosylcobinamide-GDP ribazoletransferase [Fusobacterium perfoetens]